LIDINHARTEGNKLTPNDAMRIAFDLIGGSDMFARAEQLAWVAATHPPDLSEAEYSTGLSLSFFLEAGYSPVCRITGHPYLDAALYLDRFGFHEEARIIANLEISQWLGVLMGLHTQLAYFAHPVKHTQLGRWLMTIDATVDETGALVSEVEERIRSCALRHGKSSPHVAAWIMATHTDDDLILPIGESAPIAT